MDGKKVYHLSHTDLDGYSCQLITSKIFEDIDFYNSNYGQEIDEKLTNIINNIKKDDLLLITDLNLSLEQAIFLDEESKKIGFNLLLLDHHITGKECADRFSWYFLDDKRCATKITYDYFSKEYDLKKLEFFVNCVNAYDIWLDDQKELFEIGKVLARFVLEAKEINRIMFEKDSHKYIFYVLNRAIELFDKENLHIELDNQLHFIKKSYFKDKEDDTLENLVSKYIVKLLNKNKDKMTLYFKDKKGILTYSVGNTSIIANRFLKDNNDYHFFLDINSKKNISLRANDKFDVSLFAKEMFDGGGHKNAAGGRFSDFKESFIYENIKKQVEEYLKS